MSFRFIEKFHPKIQGGQGRGKTLVLISDLHTAANISKCVCVCVPLLIPRAPPPTHATSPTTRDAQITPNTNFCTA